MLALLRFDLFSMSRGVKYLEICIFSDECWISSFGADVIGILRVAG